MPNPHSTLEELFPILHEYGKSNFNIKRLEVLGDVTSRPLEPEEPLEVLVTFTVHHHYSVTYFRNFLAIKEQLGKRIGRPVSLQDRRYLHLYLESANREARTIFLRSKSGKYPQTQPKKPTETDPAEATAEQARRLLDILTYSRKAVQFVEGIGPGELMEDEMRQLAVERCFSVIGEVSRQTKADSTYTIATRLLEKLRGFQHILTEPCPIKRTALLLQLARKELPSVIGQIEVQESELSQLAKFKSDTANTKDA